MVILTIVLDPPALNEFVTSLDEIEQKKDRRFSDQETAEDMVL